MRDRCMGVHGVVGSGSACGSAPTMNFRTSILALGSTSLVAALIAACAGEEVTASSEAAYSRGDGVFGQAPMLKAGETKKGTINNQQIDVWGVDLKQGDQITIVESITQGTLTPDFGLFAGGHTYLESASHDAKPKKLTKNYVAQQGGKHYIGVAAYQGKGAGNYSIKFTCTGGPCAGQPFVASLEAEEANLCIQKTRECAVGKARPAGGGAVGIAAARAAWTACAAEVMTTNGKACATACDGDNASLCTHATKAVQFFAAKPAACTAVFESCMSECTEMGQGAEDSERVCLDEGFNSTCVAYAKANTECGGANKTDSNEDCHALCESTDGAWNDDLDMMCEERCD